MEVLFLSIFFIGIILISVEDFTHVNKTTIALLLCVVLWFILYQFDSQALWDLSAGFKGFVDFHKEPMSLESWRAYLDESALLNSLGDVSQTVFFVLSAMAIIEIVDAHGGFNLITKKMKIKSMPIFILFVFVSTFILSAFFDNLAGAIIIMSVIRKFVTIREKRIYIAALIIIVANAGGAFSPIGDVTTLMLWNSGCITPLNQIGTLIIPCLVTLSIPLFWGMYKFKGNTVDIGTSSEKTEFGSINDTARLTLIGIGILAFILVPLLKYSFGFPPFMSLIIGVIGMWAFTDQIYGHQPNVKESRKLLVLKVIKNIDMPTILFFLGILMSVEALRLSHALPLLATHVNNSLQNLSELPIFIGLFSSLLDNVALVATTIGMYPVSTDATSIFAQDGHFWTLLAYCAVTGGSILIIGSITGVTIMGMEKISFSYFLKKVSLLALISYIVGIGVYYLQEFIF